MATKKKPAAPRRPRRKPSDDAVAQYALRSLTDAYPWGRYGAYLLQDQDASTIVRVTGILACNRFLAQSVACMPRRIMRQMPDGRKLPVTHPAARPGLDLGVIQAADTIVRRPNGIQSPYEFFEQHIYHVGLHGNGYARRVVDDRRGYVGRLSAMHPTRVEVGLVTDDELAYKLTPANGAPVPLKQDEVLHTRWLSDNSRVGMVPFELCGPALSLARKLDEAALAYWDNGGRPDVVLETEETIPEPARKAMAADWAANHGGAGNRGKAAVLPRKVKLREVTGNTAEAMQFIELRDSIVPDIARVYGIPSTLLGDHRMAKYSNSEQEFLTAFVFCLMPWALRLESAITRCLLQGYGDDIYCKVDGRGLLRGDTASRMALYQSLFNMGSITPNEIRELEDLEPLDDEAADETYMQLGFSTLAAAAAGTVDTNTAGGTTDGNP